MGKRNRRNAYYHNPSIMVAPKCEQPVTASNPSELHVPNPAFAIPDPVFTSASLSGYRRIHEGDISITITKSAGGKYRGRIAFWNNAKKKLEKYKRVNIDINYESGFIFFQGESDRGTTLSRNGNDPASIFTQITLTTKEQEFLDQFTDKDFYLNEHPRYKDIYYISK